LRSTGSLAARIVLLASGAAVTAAAVAAPAGAPDWNPERTRYLQSWFGAGDTDEPWTLPGDESAGPYRRDVGTIPYLGANALFLNGENGGGFRYGFETGGMIGWGETDAAFRSDGGDLRVALDASLFSFEVFLGGVLAYEPQPGLRFYAAAGPALAWMQLDNDEEEVEVQAVNRLDSSGIFIRVNSEEDDVSLMPYARVGFEVRPGRGYFFGLSARYVPHEFDFGSSGEVELDGVQWFLTVGVQR
jgi:hypothetical protein